MNLQGKRKLVRKIGEFEKSGVKLHVQSSRNDFWFEFIGRFKKLRVREIGIPL